MATKRRKKTSTHRRLRRKGLSEGLSAKKRQLRRSGGSRVGNALSMNNLMETGKELIGGGIGGFAGGKLYKLMTNGTTVYTPLQKLLAFGVSAFGAHMFGFKNVASGISGAYGFATSTGMPGMSEDDMEETEYTDGDALSELADAMDEDGNPMFIGDDGEYHYMEELEDDDDMNDDEEMSAQLLSDTEYPAYVNVSNY